MRTSSLALGVGGDLWGRRGWGGRQEQGILADADSVERGADPQCAGVFGATLDLDQDGIATTKKDRAQEKTQQAGDGAGMWAWVTPFLDTFRDRRGRRGTGMRSELSRRTSDPRRHHPARRSAGRRAMAKPMAMPALATTPQRWPQPAMNRRARALRRWAVRGLAGLRAEH